MCSKIKKIIRKGAALHIYYMLHVDEITKLYAIEAGCTCPVLSILSDGKRAIYKYPNNPQGKIVLFNEFFSSSIAEMMHVTSPHFGIAFSDEQTKVCKESKRDPVYFSGIGFYSEYLENVSPISWRAARHASNIEETARIILLDEIVKNTDRHVENILIGFREGNNTLYSIDYSHAIGDPEWENDSLKKGDCSSPYVWIENRDCYEILISAGGSVTEETLHKEADQIRACINEHVIDRIISGVPDEWKNDLGTTRLEAVKQYVLQRVEGLDRICEMILKERGM